MKKIVWKHKPRREKSAEQIKADFEAADEAVKAHGDAVADALLKVTDAEMLEGLSEEEIQALQQPTLSKKKKKKRRRRTKKSRASRRKQRKKKK